MRYRITVRGEVSPRFVSSLGIVVVAARAGATEVVGEPATPAELEELVERLGDLGLEIVSLRREAP
jgi:hypothetical protein